MNKTLRVAWHEYRQHVFNKRFLMGLLGVPLLILAMIGLIFLIISIQNNTTPIGYVDNSRLLADPVPPPAPEKPLKPIAMLPFTSVEDAEVALTAGEIQAYYVLPADYLTTGHLDVYYIESFKAGGQSQFNDFLGANLLARTDPLVAERLVKGADVVVRSADGSRSFSNDDWVNIFLPIIAGIAFIIAMFSTGGYLMQAVVEEKENRTMEVIITSVSPDQFMAGKIIGDLSIGLTQLLSWGVFIFVILLVSRNSFDFLRGLHFSAQSLLIILVIMLPTFVMLSALMAMVGATVVEAREGNQVTGFISMPVWIPYIFMYVLMQNPNSPLAVALGMIPLTAPLTMLLRDAFAILPAWQIGVSAVIQIAGAVGATWMAGRAFRLGMLRYGQRVRWRELVTRQKASA